MVWLLQEQAAALLLCHGLARGDLPPGRVSREGILHDVAGQRGSRVGPFVAMFDHHGDGIAWCIVRRVADEQGVRAEFPRQALLKCPCSRTQRLTRRTWLDPVLPAICTPGISSLAFLAPPPYSFTTAYMPPRTVCSASSGMSIIGKSSGFSPGWSASAIVRVTCGTTARPVAMRLT
jgi:hypothetical protein